MKLLVTGGSGFLGRRTVLHFENLGWQVLSPSHRALDITDEGAVRDWLAAHRPDAVIHTAAVSDTGRCQRKPEWSARVNVDGAVHLARACRESGAKLILCSSDQVYSGSPLPGPHREWEAVTPGNVYGCQKREAERRCLEILPDAVCLRLSWMYAKTDLPGQHGHFLTMLKGALSDENKILTWPVYDHRGLTDVADVVENLPAALELSGGIWNFGSENRTSTFDLVKSVLEELHMESALKRLTPNVEAFAGNPRDISMELTKLNAAGITFPTAREALCKALAECRKE